MTKEELTIIVKKESKRCKVSELTIIESFRVIIPEGDIVLTLLYNIEREVRKSQ